MPEIRKFVDYSTLVRNVMTVLRFDKAKIWMDREGNIDVTDTHYKPKEGQKEICTVSRSYEALMGFTTLLLPQLELRRKILILFECACPRLPHVHFVWDHKDFHRDFPYISEEQFERIKKIIEFRGEHIT